MEHIPMNMDKDILNYSLGKTWNIQLCLEICHTLTEGEGVIRALKNRHPPFTHLSVLGKTSGMSAEDFTKATACFSHLTSTATHILDISGIGEIFVAGPLSSLLLEKIDGKALGSLEGGLRGILNGYGLSNKKTFHYLEHLRNGKLMVMGWEYVPHLKKENTSISADKMNGKPF
jgi:hypothetical protein